MHTHKHTNAYIHSCAYIKCLRLGAGWSETPCLWPPSSSLISMHQQAYEVCLLTDWQTCSYVAQSSTCAGIPRLESASEQSDQVIIYMIAASLKNAFSSSQESASSTKDLDSTLFSPAYTYHGYCFKFISWALIICVLSSTQLGEGVTVYNKDSPHQEFAIHVTSYGSKHHTLFLHKI